MPFLVSKELKGFIQGKNIKDCLCLTSGVENMMDKKTRGGNINFKVDIIKVFDTVNQSNFLSVDLHSS